MTLEERIKAALGEYQLQLMAMAAKLEEAEAKIKALEEKLNGSASNPS